MNWSQLRTFGKQYRRFPLRPATRRPLTLEPLEDRLNPGFAGTPTPLTWDVIGLDSNNVTVGPNTYFVGARIAADAGGLTNVVARFVEDAPDNPYVNPVGPTTVKLGSVAAGGSVDAYFSVAITRDPAAYNTRQNYHVEAFQDLNGDGVRQAAEPLVQEPTRWLYVEKLISQARNDVAGITVAGHPVSTTNPQPITVYVGETLTVTVTGKTATQGYEELVFSTLFPTGMFRIVSVSQTYAQPWQAVGNPNARMFADAGQWAYSATNSGATTNTNNGTNKAGGDPISATYTVQVIGAGSGTLDSLINDFSGSSFHYNGDYGKGVEGVDFVRFNAVVGADLRIANTDGTTVYTAGGPTTYTVTVTNAGPSGVTGAAVQDVLPAALTGATWTVAYTGGGTGPTTGSGDINTTVDLPSGATATFTLTATVGPTTTGPVTTTAAVTAPAGVTDTDPSNNAATDTDTQTGAPDLTLTKTDGVTAVAAGGSLVYTLTYRNAGNIGATGVVLTETLPAGTTFDALNSTAGWVNSGGGTYTFAVGSLAAGAAGTAKFAVRVNGTVPAGQDQVANTARIGDDGTHGPDANPGDNSATDADTLNAAPDLVVTKSDGTTATTPAGTLTYTITVQNAGTQGATGVVLTDTLPANTAFVTATGIWSLSNGVVSWDVGPVPAGTTVTRTVTVQVNATAAAGDTTVVNSATALDDGSNGPDLNPGDNTGTDTDVLNAAPDLTLSKSDGVGQTTPGSTLTYTLTYANVGNQDATGVTLEETVPAGTSVSAAANPGWVLFAPGVYRYTVGSVAANAGGSVPFVVRVLGPAAAGQTQVVNTARVFDDGANGADPTPLNNAATDSDTLDAAPDIRVTKTDGGATVTPGGTVTYTITVSNAGNQDATGVVLTDTIPANTTLQSAPGGSLSGGVVTWSIGTLAAGTSVTRTITLLVDAAVPAGVAQITNTAHAQDDGANGTDPNPTDNDGSDTTPVNAAPDLVVTKTDGVTTARPGDTLTYTITIANTGNRGATGVTLTDTLPGGVTFLIASPGGAVSGDTVTWIIGDLAAGANTTRAVTVVVNADPQPGATSLTNTATATDDGTNGTDLNPLDNTGSDSDALGGTPDLTLTKSDGAAAAAPGGSLVYTLDFGNVGTWAATGVTITETLPAGTSFDAANSSAGWVSQGDGTFRLAVGTVGINGTGTVTFAVRVNDTVPAGLNQVFNSAVIADDGANGPDGNAADNTATDTDTLNAAPDLTLSKSDGVGRTAPGNTLTYTLTYANVGNQDATGVTLEETLPAGTSFAVGLNPGWTLVAPGVYRYTVGPVAANAGGSVPFVVTVNGPAAAGQGTVFNTARVFDDGANGVDPDGGNNTSTDTDTLDAAPDIAVTKTDGVSTTRAGDTLTYTITVSNHGNQDATGVTLTDTLPRLATLQSAPGGTVSGNSVTWDIGSLAAGTSVTRTVTVTVNGTVPAGAFTLTNTATANDDGANGADPTPDNTGTDTDTLTATPDLNLQVSDGVTATTPGSTLTYTLTYGNTGPRDASGVVITEALPAGTTFNPAANPGWAAGPNGTYTFAVGSVASGATGTATFIVTVMNPATAGLTQIVDTARIDDDGSAGADPTPLDNADSDTDTLNAAPDIRVTKTDGGATVVPGGTVTYTITVTNAGDQDATGVVLTDPVPANTTFESATGGFTLNAGVVTWSLGTLPAGASVTRTVTLLADPTVPAGVTQIANTAHAQDDGANGTDPNPADNDGADTTPVNAAPDLSVAKSDGVTTARPGDTLTYTITVANTGNRGATGVTLTDTLPANTTFVSATGGGVPAGSTVTWNVGDLAAGASTTVTVTVRVNDTIPAGVVSVANSATARDDGTNGTDPNPNDDTGTDTDTLDAAPDLMVTKNDGQVVVTPGTAVVYTLDYANTGNQDATGVVLTETLPAGTAFDAANSSGTWVDQGGGVYTLTVGPLAAGASGSATFAVTVLNPAPAGLSQVTNTATIKDDGGNDPDPNPGNDSATDTDDLNRLPAAVDDTAGTTQDTAVTIPAGDLLANDDQGDTPATVVSVSPVSTRGGTVLLNGTNVVYTPPANFSGTETFTYIIRDANGDTSSATVTVTITPLARTAAGSGRVWLDFDANGSQDAGEPGLRGLTITLTRAGRDLDFATTADNTTFTTTTGPDGRYAFPTLPAGLYRVAVTGGLPPGASATFDPDGTADGVYVFTLTDGQTRADLDFGYQGNSRLGGRVFRDYTVDGVFDPTAPTPETGIPGVTVTLTGTDVAGNTITRTTASGADGSFAFTGLLAGDYALTRGAVTTPGSDGGLYEGLVSAGTAGGTAGDRVIRGIRLGTNAAGDRYGFGLNPPADPFGYVYQDLNRNGRRDAGEPGIAGVAVTVSGTAFAGTTLARPLTTADVPGGLTVYTNADGKWEFTVIPPGTYTFTETQPAGYADGPEEDADPNGPPTAVGNDSFSNVVLTPRPVRGPFNFAEIPLPGSGGPLPPMDFFPADPADPSKRQFLGTTEVPEAYDTTTPTTPNFGAFNPGARPAAFLAVAEDAGGGWVRVFDFAGGNERFRFQPLGGFTGGVRVAVADVTGDGIPDIVTAAGPGGGPVLAVYDGNTGKVVVQALVFEPSFRGGLQVAAADLNGDGRAEVIVTPDEGGGPVVRILDGRTLAPEAAFFALDESFRGGLRIAVGDVNRDGVADLVVTAGVGGGPRVAVYDGTTLLATPKRIGNDFFGFAPELRNGFWVAAGDADGDGYADVMLGAGSGGSPRIVTYSGRLLSAGAGPTSLGSVLAGTEASRTGARVAALDLDGDGKAELAAAGGESADPMVYVLDPITGKRRDYFRAFATHFEGGVNLG